MSMATLLALAIGAWGWFVAVPADVTLYPFDNLYAAQSTPSPGGGVCHIFINSNYWPDMADDLRQSVVSHEYGHCLLGLYNHGDWSRDHFPWPGVMTNGLASADWPFPSADDLRALAAWYRASEWHSVRLPLLAR